MKKVNHKKNKGFTLIELLVVIAIIGLLSSIILASVSQARVKGRDAERISQIGSIRNALELYRNGVGNGSYPTTLTAIAPSYISAVPIDPLCGSACPDFRSANASACRMSTTTSNGYCYAFSPSTNPTDYHLGAQMESGGLWSAGDSHFNSLAAGWTGGFNPSGGSSNYVYDVKF